MASLYLIFIQMVIQVVEIAFGERQGNHLQIQLLILSLFLKTIQHLYYVYFFTLHGLGIEPRNVSHRQREFSEQPPWKLPGAGPRCCRH